MPHPSFRPRAAAAALLLAVSAMSGCTVIAVGATAAGLAVDAAVGAVKLTGAAVGAAVDLALPDGDAQDVKK